MPIENGTYQFEPLPGSKDAQKQVFGEYSSRDMSDYSAAAYNYLMQQQAQAYNLDLWRLQNEYNTPEAQMLRYQQAGLNPNLIYGQQNLGANASSASPASFRSAGTHAKSVANQLNTIGQIQGLVKSARDTFDYLQYGKETNYWQMIGAQEQALGLKLNNEWTDYLNHGENMIYGDTTRLVNGPRALLNSQEQALKAQQWRRMEYMITTLMPDQHSATQALTTLRENQAAIQDGKYGAVLDIDLGLGEKVNQWARLIIFMTLAKMM